MSCLSVWLQLRPGIGWCRDVCCLYCMWTCHRQQRQAAVPLNYVKLYESNHRYSTSTFNNRQRLWSTAWSPKRASTVRHVNGSWIGSFWRRIMIRAISYLGNEDTIFSQIVAISVFDIVHSPLYYRFIHKLYHQLIQQLVLLLLHVSAANCGSYKP